MWLLQPAVSYIDASPKYHLLGWPRTPSTIYGMK